VLPLIWWYYRKRQLKCSFVFALLLKVRNIIRVIIQNTLAKHVCVILHYNLHLTKSKNLCAIVHWVMYCDVFNWYVTVNKFEKSPLPLIREKGLASKGLRPRMHLHGYFRVLKSPYLYRRRFVNIQCKIAQSISDFVGCKL
jgi:hypothetical protein